MTSNKRISAFTLMEVTVAMLLAALVISITYTAYHMVSASYIRYQKKQGEIADLILADKLLRSDFLSSKKITRSESGISLLQHNGSINYSFSKDFIIRNQYSLRIDTFRTNVSNLDFVFEGQKKEPGQLLDGLNFTILAEGQLTPFRYKKIYSSQDLFDDYASN